MTMNKVSGFLQRMDFVRKYAFAKMAILEQKPGGPFHISGVWLFRGPEIPKQVLDESYDMELYDWKKVSRCLALLGYFVCSYFGCLF
jgi:elongation factor 1-gamma